MKRKLSKKLVLHSETLRAIRSDGDLRQAAGQGDDYVTRLVICLTNNCTNAQEAC